MTSDRTPDRYSSVLGKRVAIMQPLGTPKPREECEPFSFTFHDPKSNGSYRTAVRGRVGTKRYDASANIKAQEKFTKQLAALEKKQAAAKRAKAKA
jgi:hypothetical protein